MTTTTGTTGTTGTANDLSNITGTWAIDPTHTTIGFHARHAMVAKVRGSFGTFDGAFTLDGANPAASSATVTIQADSIDTRNADRDAHIKSADFLDVENFPTLSFTSSSVTHSGDDAFVLTGDLTVHGVTKSVDIEVTFTGVGPDPWGGTRIGFEGHTTISRKEFGLVWNAALETGGVLVSDHIKIELEVEGVKQA